MCFLKHLRLDSSKPFPAYKEYSIAKEELEDFYKDQTQVYFSSTVLPCICIPKRVCPYYSLFVNQYQSISHMITTNNDSIKSLQSKLNQNSLFAETDTLMQKNVQKLKISIQLSHHQISPKPNLTHMEEEKQRICKDEVIQKLFSDMGDGSTEKRYKFKISLDENFPSKLYKNRKFGLSLKLVPCTARSSKIILNSNLLNICIAIFDKDGKWTHENVSGEPIMNGDNQCQLYQGKGGFQRVLINEISSNMPKEKLNIAIYVIPGSDPVSSKDLPAGSNGQNPTNFIDWKSIKPLIIRNVVVLSKKTKRNRDDAE